MPRALRPSNDVRHAQWRRGPAGTADVVLCLLAVLASVVVWWPILRSDLCCDEISSMIYLSSEGPLAFVLEPYGGHVLHLRNLILWLTYLAAGLNPLPYLATTLLTHAINVALLYAVARVWFGSSLLATAVALAWGTLPLHGGSLEWYAAYGHVLAGTFTLLVLLGLGIRSRVGEWVSWRWSLALALLATAGATCFGTGIAVSVTLPVVALLLVPAERWGRRARAAVVLAPVLVATLVLTAPRVHALVAVPRGAITGHGVVWASLGREHIGATLRLAASFLEASASSLVVGWTVGRPGQESDPWSVPVLLGIGSAVIAAMGIGRTATIRRLAAFLLLSIASYGLIAAGRGSMMEAQQWTLARAAGVQRYHYLPSIGVVLALATVAATLARGACGTPHGKRLVTLGSVAFVVWASLSLRGWFRDGFEPWDRHVARSAIAGALAAADAQIDLWPAGSTVVLINKDPSPVAVRGMLPFAHLPGTAGFLLAREGTDRVRGRRVRFVEADASKRRSVQELYAGPMAAMLIAPGDVAKVLHEPWDGHPTPAPTTPPG